MTTYQIRARRLAVLLLCLTFTSGIVGLGAQKLEPVIYTLTFPEPASKSFRVEMTVPTEGRASVELMMPAWSPGFYGFQTYARQISGFKAMTPNGTNVDVTQPTPNRWKVATEGRPSIMVFYTVAAPRGSNLGNGVTDTSAVIIGPATYLGVVEPARRSVEVRLELPPTWKGSMSGADNTVDNHPNHYTTPDYDTIVDSPILAGVDLTTTEFKAGGASHYWVTLGKTDWDGSKVATWLTPLIDEHARFWGSLPYKRYAFLNIITAGGGSGVEHKTSVAITGNGKEPADQTARFRYAAFLSHEYFHAMNVKRLRPVELGPFDYEKDPKTTGLWIAEGLTSYFGDLLAARAGLGSKEDYLAVCSRHIADLQTKQPGRLVQTLEDASAQMFQNNTIPADKRVDYYVKGPVVGLVLDANIRSTTKGKKSLDDVMRLEYKRWSGLKGYTADEFWKTASDAAGYDLSPLLHKLVASTDEIDYTEMLEWFGLRFTPGEADPANPAKAWTLEVRPDATLEQTKNLTAFLAHSKG